MLKRLTISCNSKHLFAEYKVLLLVFVFSLSSFGIQTANPKAHPDAKKILQYLDSIPKKKENRVVSGQFAQYGNSLTSGYNSDIVGLNTKVGKWVAMIGTDWNDFNSGKAFQPQPLINYWKAGGLVTVSFHFPNPVTGGNSWSSAINLSDLIKSGTSSNKNWMATLDWTAANLKTLQDAGVIVLWRPFHELNGGWFWWGNASKPADLVALWNHMFQYFTKTKQLNNLLWVFAPNYGDNVTKYYPGDSLVDIVGLDSYFDKPSSINLTGYKEMVALNKPFGFTEFGGVPAAGGSRNVWDNEIFIKEIKAKYPKTSFFLHWHCPWSIMCQNNPEGLMKDPWVITRDELDWKTFDTGGTVSVRESKFRNSAVSWKNGITYKNGTLLFDNSSLKNGSIEVISINGRSIVQRAFDNTVSIVSVGRLQSGMYLVKTRSGGAIQLQKIVVK
jgi:mannan endo-1,4-beta-mannosidase